MIRRWRGWRSRRHAELYRQSVEDELNVAYFRRVARLPEAPELVALRAKRETAADD